MSDDDELEGIMKLAELPSGEFERRKKVLQDMQKRQPPVARKLRAKRRGKR